MATNTTTACDACPAHSASNLIKLGVNMESSDYVVALAGNPNTGKSTLFNSLTGLRQKTANYPGVTVERHTGIANLGDQEATLIDLPGAYSLSAQSPDEMVAIDVLMGGQDDLEPPDAILIVVDAANLRRNLFLVSQILELGKPVVVALNMADLADRKGIRIDCEELAMLLDSAVVPFVATVGRGIDGLKQALADALEQGRDTGGVAQTRAVIDVVRTEGHAHELLE